MFYNCVIMHLQLIVLTVLNNIYTNERMEMDMEKMLVTVALNELKLLDSRITKEICCNQFVSSAKKISNKVSPTVTKDEFISEAKSGFQSVRDLIERRAKIKAAIVDSNAKTEVEVNGVKMTRADAIERKSSIDYDKLLLQELKTQLSSHTSRANANNIDVENKIDTLVQAAYGREGKQNIKPEDYEAIAKPYRASNEWEVVDPLDVSKIIDCMEKEIEGFEAEIDSVLQISNCTSYIEF